MYYSFSDIENGNGSNNRGGGIMMRNSKRAMNRLSSVGWLLSWFENKEEITDK